MEASESPEERSPFDFKAHGQEAVSEYLKVRPFFADLSNAVERIVRECLKHREIKVNSVTSRAKEPESFEEKAAKPSDVDPGVPKYRDPLREITDLAGVRVITFFPDTLGDVERVIYEQFDVIERVNKNDALIENERFGYQSIHFLVTLKAPRTNLPEFERFGQAIVEVQVRTVLQHAWAEIEHDIQYKSALAIPGEINRRFMALAALLELADREFQDIRDADRRLEQEAQARVEGGNLDVEITPNTLKVYLDRRLGSDNRISNASYDWLARVLKNLGFTTLAQIDTCIAPYDDDEVSRAVVGYRQGQTTRFEQTVLAGMGETFIARHPFAKEPWWEAVQRDSLDRLKAAGIAIGSCDPRIRD